MDETQPAADLHDRPSAGVSRLSPDEIAARTFPAARKGVAEPEVRAFLRRVADELAAARSREQDLLGQLERVDELRRSASPLSEEELLHALGEETAAVLRSAREAAEDMRRKSQERAAAVLEEAQEQAARIRTDSEAEREQRLRDAAEQAAHTVAEAQEQAAALRADAEQAAADVRQAAADAATAQVDAAKAQGRQVLEDTKALRERILGDLTHRRTLLQAQIQELTTGRDRLIDAYRTVRQSFLDATEALTRAESEIGPAPEIDEAEIDRILAAELAEPGPAAGAEAQQEDAPATDPATDPAAGAEAEQEDAPADVEDLFARLRAEQEAAALVAEADELAASASLPASPTVAPTPSAVPAATAPPAADPAAASVDEPAEPALTEPDLTEPDPAAAGLQADTAALHAQLAGLASEVVGRAARAAKRTAQDEQNAVLDAVRRSKGRPGSAAVLPALDPQVGQWGQAIAAAVAEGYAAGWSATRPGDAAPPVPGDLVAALATALVTPLRSRLVAAIDETPDLGADTTPHIIERISARYREWKTQWAESELTDMVYGAYARGVLDAAGPGVALQWVNPPSGCSPDCADNALEPTRAGSAFPTGAIAPPAHPGCRCLLTPAGASTPA